MGTYVGELVAGEAVLEEAFEVDDEDRRRDPELQLFPCFLVLFAGGAVPGERRWVGGWVEEIKAVGMRCCGSCMGEWMGR